jgi:membrane fusion protein (multidrug efflux system)
MSTNPPDQSKSSVAVHKKRPLWARIFGSLAVVLVVLGVAGGLAWYKWREVQAAMNQPAWEAMETVSVAPAQVTTFQPTQGVVGTVAPVRMVTLKNELVGTVKAINITSGTTVKSGDVLLTLDDSVDRANIAAAEAAVISAEANIRASQAEVALAETNVRRIEAAVETNAAPKVDLDRARAEVDRARSALERDKAAVLQYKAQVLPWRAMMDKKTVRAPFGGRVGIVDVHEGQYLGEGTQITTLQELADHVYVDFAVPQALAMSLSMGSKVRLATEQGEDLCEAEIVAADTQIDRETRNAYLRGKAGSPAAALRPGASVRVIVPMGPQRTAVVVPVTALRKGPEGDHVYLVEDTTPADAPKDDKGQVVRTFKAVKRAIDAGPSMGNGVLVRGGLKPGDQVATSGSFKLRDGVKVMILPDPAHAAMK